MSISTGSRITSIELLRPAAGGKAVAMHEQQVVLVSGGVVGDIVSLEINAVKANHLEAETVTIEIPSKARQEPQCKHFTDCGGCQLQDTQYSYQLENKQQVLNDTLERIGGKAIPKVSQIIAAEETFFYRNKLSFSFSKNCWQTPNAEKQNTRGLGFHLANGPGQVLNIEQCYLQSSVSNQVLNSVRDYANEQGLSYYDLTKNRGLLRDLVIRQNRDGELMLIFQVSYESEGLNDLLTHLLSSFKALISVFYVVNTTRNNNYLSLPLVHFAGASHLGDTLGSLKYEISPKAFYQTNPEQTEHLYQQVEKFAQLSSSDVVYDLYCGTGTIGLWLAATAKKVIGIESIPEAVTDAKRNALLNAITNTAFHIGKVEAVLDDVVKAEGKPNVIVVDPPRAGLDKQLVQQLNALKVSRLVYVSCEPASFARDLKLLSEVYKVVEITAVDMFPQTFHIESVALLTPLKKKAAAKKPRRSLKY